MPWCMGMGLGGRGVPVGAGRGMCEVDHVKNGNIVYADIWVFKEGTSLLFIINIFLF